MNLELNYLELEPLPFFKDVLLKISDPQVKDHLFKHPLRFGTAGLRGIMQPGPAGINGYTICQATKALADYLKHLHPGKNLTVCISYDNRHHSMQFAELSARILAHEGIGVKLARHLRPTPWLSFAIKEIKADAGIMITASHNPKNYNGFKVYLADGGQIVSPHDKNIMALIEKTHTFSLTHPHNQLIEFIEEDIDQRYLRMLSNKLIHQPQADLKIVYSPLCGTGGTMIPKALKMLGFEELYTVDEEMKIDPDFAGLQSPNPETSIAMKRAIDLMIKTQADIALVTDPDADRIGLALRHHHDIIRFSGNDIAVLILDYLTQTTKELDSKIVVSSFVTTHLLKKICQAHKIRHIEVLTGFKYIGQVIEDLENKKEADRFLLGAEESYGYLIGTHAKDKDAIIIACYLAKAAQHAKKSGQTLQDRLQEIYRTYGLYIDTSFTLEYPAGTQPDELKQKLIPLMTNYPKTILSEPVTSVINYQTQTVLDIQTHKKSECSLPKADALGIFSDHAWLIIRPSGTEPKLKIYAGLSVTPLGNIEEIKKNHLQILQDFLKQFSQKYLV